MTKPPKGYDEDKFKKQFDKTLLKVKVIKTSLQEVKTRPRTALDSVKSFRNNKKLLVDML